MGTPTKGAAVIAAGATHTPMEIRSPDAYGLDDRELVLLGRSLAVSYLAIANARFDQRVHVEFLGCHYWAGSKNLRGYGKFRLGDRVVATHRFAYERTRGVIPDRIQVDHICRNPPCVNVEHLQLVTQQQNLALARIRAGKRSSYGRHDALNDGLAVDLVDVLLLESEPSLPQCPPAWVPPVSKAVWGQLDEGWSDTRFHHN